MSRVHHLEDEKETLDFHPCMTPRGMKWYDLNTLTKHQQKTLNDLKINIIRENNKYLAGHPEIRALIVLFVKALLRLMPHNISIASIAKMFFSRSKTKLQKEIQEYLKERGEPISKEGNSAVTLDSDPCRSTLAEEELSSHKDLLSYMSYIDFDLKEKWEKIGEEEESRFTWVITTQPSSAATTAGLMDFDFSSYLMQIAPEDEESMRSDERYFGKLFPSIMTPTSDKTEATDITRTSLDESTIDITKKLIHFEIYGEDDFKTDHDTIADIVGPVLDTQTETDIIEPTENITTVLETQTETDIFEPTENITTVLDTQTQTGIIEPAENTTTVVDTQTETGIIEPAENITNVLDTQTETGIIEPAENITNVLDTQTETGIIEPAENITNVLDTQTETGIIEPAENITNVLDTQTEIDA